MVRWHSGHHCPPSEQEVIRPHPSLSQRLSRLDALAQHSPRPAVRTTPAGPGRAGQRRLLDTFGDSLKFVNHLFTVKWGHHPRKVSAAGETPNLRLAAWERGREPLGRRCGCSWMRRTGRQRAQIPRAIKRQASKQANTVGPVASTPTNTAPKSAGILHGSSGQPPAPTHPSEGTAHIPKHSPNGNHPPSHQVPAHMPHIIDRDVMAALWREWPAQWEATRPPPF